jgi:OmcA/MtrC family decaheme c-type cytochrome
VGVLAGCGGSGGSTSGGSTPSTSVKDSIAAAGALATNDTATNPSAPFTVVQTAGLPAVVVSGPPKVNFAVFSDGQTKADLTMTNLSFAIAKLVPGSSGNPDQWVNYIYRKETATAGVGPGGVPALASAWQATTDGKQTDPAQLAAQLVYNPDGYYTYTFKTDITQLAQTNNVVFEPTRTHRVAIQLSYKNAAGATVLVNPYFDFTIDANGNSVPVSDSTKTRKMVDVASCNNCHDKLSLHGGGRVDPQFCVMCHNPGTIDANSGNVLTLSTMVHKIHAGKLLASQLAAGGEDYTIWGYQDSVHSYADVGFPQDLRNCSKCHTGANPATPQGDNWKSKPSKEACLTCHASNSGSAWDGLHSIVAGQFFPTPTPAKSLPNSECVRCHGAGSVVGSDRVHFNQAETNAAKYKMNIQSVAFNDTADHKGRSVAVTYFLSDPTNGNAAYNLVTSDCTGVGTASLSCGSSAKFGNLRFNLGYQNMVGQSALTTEYSAYNNGGNGATAYAYLGKNDGSNHYTLSIPLPDDSATAVATGTARVITVGQVKEPLLRVTWSTDPRPPVVPTVLIDTPVQHTYSELALSGTLQARRTVVATEKCNVCHSTLGSASGSNTLPTAFHSGARNTVEACIVCHDANRASSTVMTNGMALNESYQFKRLIHGIHGNSKRMYPFTHGNSIVGKFNMDGTSATTGGKSLSQQTDSAGTAIVVDNYAAEVQWPGMRAIPSINCNACHVDNSYRNDASPLGAAVISNSLSKDKAGNYTNPNVGIFEAKGACVGATGSIATKNLACTATDWSKIPVISPKAATCTSCHDGLTSTGTTVISHVTEFGGATFGTKTQAEVAALPRETCNDCHANGGTKNVDIVHGLN